MWELDLMQSIIVAIIGAAGGIFAVLLGELLLGKKVSDVLKNHVLDSRAEHKELSKEYSNLSREHSNLSKEHGNILSDLKNYIMEKTTATNNILLDERRNQEFRYNNLNESQKVIVDSVSSLGSFAREFERVISENKRLWEKVESLNIDKAEMAAQIRRMNKEISEYEKDDEWER